MLPQHLDRAALALGVDQRAGERAGLDDLAIAVDDAVDRAVAFECAVVGQSFDIERKPAVLGQQHERLLDRFAGGGLDGAGWQLAQLIEGNEIGLDGQDVTAGHRPPVFLRAHLVAGGDAILTE